ncbi:MAG: TonB-dependent receptor [Caulobacterales bacterium]
MTLRLRAASFVLAACAAAAGTAQAADDIVVTGAPLPAALSDQAYDVKTIDAARLQSTASARIEDVLRDGGGLTQFRRSDSRSAHPTSQGASLRGLGGNAASRALVLLDGVPVADPFGGWVDWPSLDPRGLGAVRVTRGGGAGAFGTGALAGVAELQSTARDQTPVFDGGVAIGERESYIADARGKADVLNGFVTLSGRYDTGDGFTPILKSQRGAVDRPAPYDQWTVRARYVGPVVEGVELQTALSAFGDKRERGTDFTDNKTTGQDVSLRLIGRGAWGWEALVFAQNRDFESQFASVAPDRATVTQSLDQFDTPSHGYGGKLELRPPVGENAELRVGVDYRWVDGETNELFRFVDGLPVNRRKAGGNNQTAGAFIEYSVQPIAQLTLTATGRLDYWRIADGELREANIATGAPVRDVVGANRDDWEALGRIGASYALTETLSLRAAAYQSYRLPTLNELYRPFRAGADATAANLDLTPEKLHGAEIGAESKMGELTLGATIFWNRLEDAIANVSIGKLPGDICPGVGVVAGACRQRQNLSAIESVGVELDASYVWNDWRVLGAYAFADSEVRGSALHGLRPAQTPKHQGSVTVEWKSAQGLRAALTGRYLAGQFEDDLNVRRLDSAATLDAFVAVPLKSGLSLELRGENITDTRVEAAVSGLGVIERATPRTLWAALRYRM